MLCRDKANDSMPLIKFARKLAEAASENRNAAELEAQVVDMQEGEPEQVCFLSELSLPGSKCNLQVYVWRNTTGGKCNGVVLSALFMHCRVRPQTC